MRTFDDPADADGYFAAYDAVLAKWPAPVERIDVPSAYGTTRVHAYGPPDGTPLVLLHGGGATSMMWFSAAAALGRTRRLYAVDLIGDPGRSVHSGRPLRRLDDLMDWLGAVLDGLGLGRTDLCGHSYGGWIALNLALRAPGRIRRLVLLDPSSCFTGMRPTYVLRALPLFVRPRPARTRAFAVWETAGVLPDPDWLNLWARSADFPATPVVMPRRPADEQLRAFRTPTLILLAERTRSHDIRRLAANAHRLLPHAVTAVLPGTAHHNVPMVGTDRFTAEADAFLAG